MEIFIFGLLALLSIGLGMTFINSNNILEITNDRMNNLEQDVSELHDQVEDLKCKEPEEMYRVELLHYVDGEPQNTVINNVIRVDNFTTVDYYTGEATKDGELVIVKENGQFTVRSENVITIDQTKM